MEAPIGRLQPELLALIFEGLESEERTLCTMTHKYWCTLIKGLWPKLKTSPDGILDWAAEIGNTTLIRFITKWGAADFDGAMTCAARTGHTECMKLLKDCGITLGGSALSTITAVDLNEALIWAAAGGHLNCMKLLKEWGATDLDEALACAA